MDRDLKKVVILLAHPNMKESQANKALVDAIKDIEEVAIYNLYELQTFNVDEWSKIISHASNSDPVVVTTMSGLPATAGVLAK